MSSLFDFPTLRIRDFRLLIINKFLITFGAQMIAVIVGWQVYQLTHDPLSLGLIGFAEAVAFIAFALWAGHIADRTEKRLLIVMSEIVVLICAIALWGLTRYGNQGTLPIYLVIAASGVARAFLWSSSTSYSETIIPKEIYSSAAAWNSSAWEIASILGPAAGGLLYGFFGPKTAYGVAVGVIGAALYYGIDLGHLHPISGKSREKVIESLTSGIRFVFSHQMILAALALDMFAVLFGGVVAVLPVFADILKVGPIGLGILRASQSFGAITMALIQTRRPPFRNPGRTLLTVVSLFGLCIIAFGLSHSFYLSILILAIAGMVDNVSVVIRASILQAATPNSMRGRVSAVNGIFIGSSNEIGAFESGVAAKYMGLVPSVLFGGVMTLLTVAGILWRFPQLRKLKSIQSLAAGEGFESDIASQPAL
jgi:MFS family permease